MGFRDFQFEVATPLGASEPFNDCYVTEGITTSSLFFETRQTIGLVDAYTYNIFDLSAIPSSSVIAAKIDIVANGTRTTDFQLGFHTIDEEPILNSISPQTIVRHNDGRFQADIFQFLTPLSSSNSADTAGNNNVRVFMDGRHNFEMRFNQTMTIDTSGNATFSRWRLGSSFIDQGTGTFWPELWSVTGSAGEYMPDQLLTTGAATPMQIADIAFGGSLHFMRISPVGGPDHAVNPGDVVMMSLVFSPNGDHTANSWIDIQSNSDIAVTPGLGFTDNMVCFGDPELQGMGRLTNFLTPNALRDGVTPAVGIAFPRPLRTWTDGEHIAIGDEAFSPTIELDITPIIQNALTQSQSGYICIRMLGILHNPSTDSRRFLSSRSATETFPGKTGMVLTIRMPAGPLRIGGFQVGSDVSAKFDADSSVDADFRTESHVGATHETQNNIGARHVVAGNISAKFNVGARNV